jgi:nucleoside-diphosphate-sugar epimerase
MYKVFIMGGAGMVGAGIARILNKALLSKTSVQSISDVRFGSFNAIRDMSTFENSLLIISCGPRDEDINKMDSNYLNNVKYFFEQLPATCKIGYVSSARIFEGSPFSVINENTKAHPESDYAEYHLKIEDLLKASLKQHIIVRPQAVYNYSGCNSKRSYLVTNAFPESLLGGGDIILKSDGSQVKNFISAEDIGRAFLYHALSGTNGPINVLGLRSLSIKNYKQILDNLYGIISSGKNLTIYSNIHELNKIADMNSYASIYSSVSCNDILIDSLYFLRKNYAK